LQCATVYIEISPFLQMLTDAHNVPLRNSGVLRFPDIEHNATVARRLLALLRR
jgi:hypothetical protein